MTGQVSEDTETRVALELGRAHKLVQAVDTAEELIYRHLFDRRSGRGWQKNAETREELRDTFYELRRELGEEVTAEIWKSAVEERVVSVRKDLANLYDIIDPNYEDPVEEGGDE